MKKKLLLGLGFLILLILAFNFSSCEQSEGVKYGTLQKISHKKYPCEYYVAEFSFEGGKAVANADGKSSTFSNTQVVSITKECADTLEQYIGDKVLFDYKDRGGIRCEESKILTMIKRK